MPASRWCSTARRSMPTSRVVDIGTSPGADRAGHRHGCGDASSRRSSAARPRSACSASTRSCAEMSDAAPTASSKRPRRATSSTSWRPGRLARREGGGRRQRHDDRQSRDQRDLFGQRRRHGRRRAGGPPRRPSRARCSCSAPMAPSSSANFLLDEDNVLIATTAQQPFEIGQASHADVRSPAVERQAGREGRRTCRRWRCRATTGGRRRPISPT